MKSTTFALDGLQTDPGPFSGASDGALVEAQNVVCERDGLIEPRGPMALTADAALVAGYTFHHGHQVEGQPRRTWSRRGGTPFDWLMRSGGTTTITGPVNFIKGRVQSEYVKNRLLFTSEDGVCEWPQSGTLAIRAGLPAPSMPWGYVSTGSWLANGASVAYRFTITRTRADGTPMESPPTAPFIVRNTSGSSGGVTFIPLPGLTYTPWDVNSTFDVLQAGDLLNVYRAPVLASATGTPSDVMRLRASLPIVSGSVQPFNDLLADADWSGPLLYTSSTRDGILLARTRPSYARDICTYNGMAIYAGVKTPQRLNVVCKAIGDISNDPLQSICTKTVTVTTAVSTALTAISAADVKYLAPGQWITLSYGAGGTPGLADARFSVDTQIASVNYSGGTATLTKPALAAGAVSVTVWDWISVQDGVSTFRMYAQEPANTTIADTRFLQGHTPTGNRMGGYADLEFRWNNATTRIKDVLLHAFGNDEVGGLPEFRNVSMTFERASMSATPFTIRSSKPDAFSRPVDRTTGVVSAQDGNDARIGISTPSIPDACPIGQTIDIGDLSSPIYRVLPARSSVVVIKGDGIFLVYGSSPSTLTVTMLDGTISPPRFDLSADWITKLGDTVFMMSSRGPVAITDAGVTPFGQDIYESLREIFGPGFENVGVCEAVSCGATPQTPYVFFSHYRFAASKDVAESIYAYNTETEAWTTWRSRRACTAIWTGSNGAPTFGFTFGRVGVYRDDRTSMGAPITYATQPLTGDTGESFTIAPVLVGTNRYTISKATSVLIEVGDVLVQGITLAVVEVTGLTSITVVTNGALTNGSAAIIESYPVRLVWTARTLGTIAKEKRYISVSFAFALRAMLLRLTGYFQTAYAPAGVQTVAQPQISPGWTDGGASDVLSLLFAPEQITCGVPLEVVRDWGARVGFTHQQALSWFSLGGVVIDVADGGPRIGRNVR